MPLTKWQKVLGLCSYRNSCIKFNIIIWVIVFLFNLHNNNQIFQTSSSHLDVTTNIAHLIQQRTAIPIQCNSNSKYNKTSKIYPVEHNWVPYFYRCRFKHIKALLPGEIFLTKELNYIHAFKSGGTPIMHGLVDLLHSNQSIKFTLLDDHFDFNNGGKGLSSYRYSTFIEDSTFIFSFVRDPIDKFLSGVYESNRKQIENNNTLNGIDILRQWLDEMRHKPKAKWRDIDIHLWPNMKFIHQSIPFDFIGNLYNLESDMYQIIKPFVLDETLLNNDSFLMNKYFYPLRNRNYYTKKPDKQPMENESWSKYNINRLELSDSDIKIICEIYWMDYICLPFDVPKQCNLSDLFEKHYNKHVLYDSCY